MCMIFRPQPNYLVVIFFFSLLRPPPTSTLFPYTTLFRSDMLSAVKDGSERPTQIMYRANLSWLALYIDRKSTRLNSSHVAISYAVFCLKKKKKMYLDNTLNCHLPETIQLMFQSIKLVKVL